METQLDLFGEKKAHQSDLAEKRELAKGTVTHRNVKPKPLKPTGVLWRDCTLSDKLQTLLAELQRRGEWSCFDVDQFMHRGQAAMGKLREFGWRWRSQDGVYTYEGPPLEQHVAVLDALQSRYYQTSHWQSLAKERKKLDGYRCVMCHCRESLQTHHWVYRLFEENVMRDLMTLCGSVEQPNSCHAIMHSRIKGSGVHFPRVLKLSMAQRIAEESTCS